MAQTSDAFFARARESLAGAASEFGNGRYNNTANRAYYACFQVAIAALELADIRPVGGKAEWGHAFVQSRFTGLLINRRKRYPSELRNTLTTLLRVRQQGDYEYVPVTETQAARALARARTFAERITMHQQGGYE